MAGNGRGHGEKRSRLAEALIAALLTSSTIEEAASKARVSVRSARRWMADESFKRLYAQARRDSLDQAVARLHQVTGLAVASLAEVLSSPDAPPAAKVSAARTILEFGFRGAELADIEARIERLERGSNDASMADSPEAA